MPTIPRSAPEHPPHEPSHGMGQVSRSTLPAVPKDVPGVHGAPPIVKVPSALWAQVHVAFGGDCIMPIMDPMDSYRAR